MKFSPENKCKFCLKLFCCRECRIKHEIKVHFSLFFEVVNCDLCNGKERIVLQQENTNEFIEHLFMFHLPLQCRNCSAVFQNKVDLIVAHTCVSSDKAVYEKFDSKMALEGDGKIEPIIEEDIVHQKIAENSKPCDGSVAENGSSACNGSSINNSENTNQTPPNTLVRQTSTPMTKMLHEVKRHSYDSMSASSIQMSSIANTSSENDISPPIPFATSNMNIFKQPSRRMPVGITPYRQIMSKSIQRALCNQGISRVRCVDMTPPLDLRTSPVIRRTISMEGKRKLRKACDSDANMIDLRTTPVIRRTRQIEAKNLATLINARKDEINGTSNETEQNKFSDENNKSSTPEALQKSSLSRSKSTSTFFETCKSFEENVTSSNQITETPKTSGLSKRSSSFSNRQAMKMSQEQEQWFTPSLENAKKILAGSADKLFADSSKLTSRDRFSSSPENSKKIPAGSTDKLFADSSKVTNGNGVVEVDLHDQPSKGIIWSLFSSVFKLGGTSNDSLTSNDNNSLIKRCASFTGILPKKPAINLDNDDENPYKRRRTTTISEVEKYSQLEDAGNDSGKRVQRINGRPPIERMRQS